MVSVQVRGPGGLLDLGRRQFGFPGTGTRRNNRASVTKDRDPVRKALERSSNVFRRGMVDFQVVLFLILWVLVMHIR